MTTYILNFNSIDSAVRQEAREISREPFEDLYARYYRSVYKICLKMTSNVSDAEDLTHDVFIQVQRKIASFRGDSAFTTWLHRIAVNQVLMHFRKKFVKLEVITEDGEMPEKAAPFNAKSHIPTVDSIALTTAIEKLPTGYRKVFLLHDVEGYEHEEIAKILGINAGTSKSQLHKARMKLRTLLNEQNKPVEKKL